MYTARWNVGVPLSNVALVVRCTTMYAPNGTIPRSECSRRIANSWRVKKVDDDGSSSDDMEFSRVGRQPRRISQLGNNELGWQRAFQRPPREPQSASGS